MKLVGAALIVFGILLIVKAVDADTTIFAAGQEINNIGLMHMQMMGFLTGATCVLSGVITIAATAIIGAIKSTNGSQDISAVPSEVALES